MSRRITVDMLVNDLGYCCAWVFFKVYNKTTTSIIAARLGVTTRAIRYKRCDFGSSKMACPNQKDCMKKAFERRKIK